MSLYKCMRVGIYFLISLVIMKEMSKTYRSTNILISIDSSVVLDWHDYGCWQRRLTN
jgi:hypothetical protein